MPQGRGSLAGSAQGLLEGVEQAGQALDVVVGEVGQRVVEEGGVLVGDGGQLVAARGGEADVAGAGVGLVLVPDDEAVLLEAGERPADDRGRDAGRLREVAGTVLAGLRWRAP